MKGLFSFFLEDILQITVYRENINLTSSVLAFIMSENILHFISKALVVQQLSF